MAGSSGGTLMEAAIGMASGMAFGLVTPIVGHPFDTVKTKMQGEARHRTRPVFAVVRHTWRAEGVRGFYRGLIPPLIGSTFYRGISFSAYSGAYAACDGSVLAEAIPGSGGLRGSVLVGGFCSAAARSVIETPLELIKVRRQTGQGWRVGAAARDLVSTRQLHELYKGSGPTFFRTWVMVSSFFVFVDYSVRLIPDVVNTPLVGPFFKGGVCATAAWALAWPFETAKSLAQADVAGGAYTGKSTWAILRRIVAENGIPGLYRGFAPGAARSFAANGASMIVYELFQKSQDEETDD